MSTDEGSPGLPADRDGYRYLLLRREDIEPLRGFRNEQLDVLRQKEPISPEQQERWFDQVVAPARREQCPSQILVSILDGEGAFIGYGGLTNIDWDAQRAEVSFLVDPRRVGERDVYAADISAFLSFLSEWAFDQLGLNRLFTETYAFRDFHISLLERAGFSVEGRLREHVVTRAGRSDSIIHGLLASEWRER